MRKTTITFLGLIFSMLVLAQAPLRPLTPETFQQQMEKLMEQFERSQKAAQDFLKSPEYQKVRKQMEKDLQKHGLTFEEAMQGLSEEKIAELDKAKGVEEREVAIRTDWDFGAAFHKGPYTSKDCPTWSPFQYQAKLSFSAQVDFVGTIKRVFPEGEKRPGLYWFEETEMDYLEINGFTYQAHLENKYDVTDCGAKRAENGEPILSLPDILVTEPEAKGMGHMGLNIGAKTKCKGRFKTAKIPSCTDPDDLQEVTKKTVSLDDLGMLAGLPFLHPEFLFLMTGKDFEQLFKEGFWEERYPAGFRSEMAFPPEEVAQFPVATMIVAHPFSEWDYRGEVKVEIDLEPRIRGPHYLAMPFYTIERQTTDITLQVDPPRGWQVSQIKPIGGWEKAREFVHKTHEEGPPRPSVTLEPASPGKVSFEIDWTSPKGEKGKSPPFEVTVVLLEFKRVERCDGYDDTLNFSTRVHAVSLCEQKTKRIEIEITPSGTSVITELRPQNKSAFGAMPPIFSSFPQEIVLSGSLAKETTLAAFIEVEEGKWQKAAELSVDVLEPKTLKVLPVIVKTPLHIAPMDIDNLFGVAKRDMTQTCVEIEKMPVERLDATQIPGYTEGDVLDYEGAGWQALARHGKRHLSKGQEVTAFFLPEIRTNGDHTPAGFYNKATRSLFVDAHFGLPHVLSHEIGHHVFGHIYPESEKRAHTKDAEQLMYYVTSNNCEIRIDEWRLRD